jgi:hypothetical protein
MKWFKHHPKDGKRYVPAGGLTVGGDRLRAGQVQAILGKAGHGRNLRFELEGELIATLLNQLRRASTPSSVQAAINASQFLLSQHGGALHNGAINTSKLDWWTTVTYNRKTYRANQLVDTHSSFNEGAAKGGPRPCRKHRDDGHDDDNDDGQDDDKDNDNKNCRWRFYRRCSPS